MADILREQLRYLAPPLVTYILEVSAYQAERSCYRLQEDNLFHLLRIVSADGAHHEDDLPVEDVETEWDDDWDAPELATTALHHLAITLHPSPQTLLGRLRMPLTFAQTSMTSASSLTSLNLAYSTLPTDLDKLVNLLPSGLRELSLVGVRFRGETVRKADVNRGFASLGRKLIVLTVSLAWHVGKAYADCIRPWIYRYSRCRWTVKCCDRCSFRLCRDCHHSVVWAATVGRKGVLPILLDQAPPHYTLSKVPQVTPTAGHQMIHQTTWCRF